MTENDKKEDKLQVKESSKKDSTITNKKPIRNFWQYAFFLLLGLVIGLMIFLTIRITTPRETAFKESQVEQQLPENPSLQVTTTKAELNKVISHYLNEFLKDSGIKYEFYLENQALLNGTFKILGYPIEFYLYFEPYVMQDGNIQLKAKSVSIGSLTLPISEVMKQVSKFDLPKWVEVDPKNEYIILHLDQFELYDGIYFRADRINLVDDDIRLNVYLDTTSSTQKKEAN